ncbi:MAG: glycosyltransferase [Microthrixaceae bacterium]|nr:glycosyltransferase [Microthrixaceae bacterium]
MLWLANGLGVGGMERLLVTHARLGDRDAFEYHAAYLVDRPHSVVRELEELGVPVYRLGTGRRSDLRWVRDLVHIVRSREIDVVHAHSPLPASVARVALALTARNVRFVYTEHNRWDRFEPLTRWANRLTYRLNDKVFAVSDDCRSTVPKRLRPRVETLIHGIDVEAVAANRAFRDEMRAELGIDDDTVAIGTVANLRKQKNYPMLMRAAKRLIDDGQRVVFLAVGQGPLEDELNQLHSVLGLGDRFRFLGFREDVHRVMSAFDVFCLSSDHEGLPVALMEAKALGLPVVATAVGGIPDAVEDGVDGLLVGKGDGSQLLEALESQFVELCARKRLASAALLGAGRFGAGSAVQCVESVYRGDAS